MSMSSYIDLAVGLVFGAAAIAFFVIAVSSGLPRQSVEETIHISAANLPPQMDGFGKGREAEIIVAALRAGGVTQQVEFHIVPFTRHWQAYQADERMDAVATVPSEVRLKGIRSVPYIYYQNGVFYRNTSFPAGLGNDPVVSLFDKRVVAFAGSTAVLPELLALSKAASLYIERADQFSHSIMLENGFVDAVIADELIFTYYTKQLLGSRYENFSKRIRYETVFCPTPYQMMFRDYELAQAFNAGLKAIIDNDELEMINKKYMDDRKLPQIKTQLKLECEK